MTNSSFEAATPHAKRVSRLSSVLFVAICIMGIFLRTYFYLVDRSLWLDEAWLAINIVGRSFLGLLRPLDAHQGAPIGFLLLEKAVVSLLGSSDLTLRIIPLLAGIASVPLMYFVARQYSTGLAVFLSLGLFALSTRLIYYSSEVKQYSSDVFITVLLLFVFHECVRENASPSTLVALGIAGCLGIWISHPALFVDVGVLITLALAYAKRKDTRLFLWLIGVGAVWGTGLILDYLVSLRHLAADDILLRYWQANFAPVPPWSNFGWYPRVLMSVLRDPARLPVNAITVGLLILGIVSLAFRRWQLLLVLLIPPFLALIASALRKYPFGGRLLLFLIPIVLLLLSEGVERIRLFLLRVNGPFALLVSASLAVYLVSGPIILAYAQVKSPPMKDDIKPVMSYMSKRRLGTDVIAVLSWAQPAFTFYAPSYGLAANPRVMYLYTTGDVDALKGNPRVWFVFSHKPQQEVSILGYLDKIGHRLREFRSSGSSVYLYDLAEVPQEAPPKAGH